MIPVHLAQDRVQWQTFEHGKEYSVSVKCGELLTNCMTISFSKMALFRGVCQVYMPTDIKTCPPSLSLSLALRKKNVVDTVS
jgi:hypothetical protein